MADTFKRLSNLIKGVSSEWMSKVEADNPDAVVRAASEGARDRYDQLLRQVGRLRADGERAVGEREKLSRELATLRAQRAAVAAGSDVALRLDDAIARLAAREETLDAEAAERTSLEEELKVRAAELRKEAEGLRGEGDSLKARSIVAQEATSAESLAAGAPSRAYERALQSVRDRAEADRRAADTGVPGDAELGRLKAEARLAALKAQRAPAAPAPVEAPAAPVTPTPQAGDATPAEAASPEAPATPPRPSPVPDRDL